MRSIYVVVDFRMPGKLNISKQPLAKDEIACHEQEHVVRKVGISMSDPGSPTSVIDEFTNELGIFSVDLYTSVIGLSSSWGDANLS